MSDQGDEEPDRCRFGWLLSLIALDVDLKTTDRDLVC